MDSDLFVVIMQFGGYYSFAGFFYFLRKTERNGPFRSEWRRGIIRLSKGNGAEERMKCIVPDQRREAAGIDNYSAEHEYNILQTYKRYFH